MLVSYPILIPEFFPPTTVVCVHPRLSCFAALTSRFATALSPGNAVEIPTRILWILHPGPCDRRHYIHRVLNVVEEERHDVEHDL